MTTDPRQSGEWPREWTNAERHLATEQRLQRKLLEEMAADRKIDRVAMSHLVDRVREHDGAIEELKISDREIRARVDHIQRSITLPVEGRKTPRRNPIRWLLRRPIAIVAALVLSAGLALAALLFTTRSS